VKKECNLVIEKFKDGVFIRFKDDNGYRLESKKIGVRMPLCFLSKVDCFLANTVPHSTRTAFIIEAIEEKLNRRCCK